MNNFEMKVLVGVKVQTEKHKQVALHYNFEERSAVSLQKDFRLVPNELKTQDENQQCFFRIPTNA